MMRIMLLLCHCYDHFDDDDDDDGYGDDDGFPNGSSMRKKSSLMVNLSLSKEAASYTTQPIYSYTAALTLAQNIYVGALH